MTSEDMEDIHRLLHQRGVMEIISRRMCIADGHEPDRLVLQEKIPMIGPNGHPMVNTNPIPSWTTYYNHATLAVDVVFKLLREEICDNG